jgi:hypothetical protein
MSLSGGELNDIVVSFLILLPLVLFFQITIFCVATMHPFYNYNNCIPGIIYLIVLITSVISFIEVSFVSWMAATFVLIFWGFLIASIFMADLAMELDGFLKPKTEKNVTPEGQGNIERMLTG